MENSTENTTELTIKNEKSNSKIRNPFPWIGKVFKYEMKHSIRNLGLVYIIFCIFSFIAGVFVFNKWKPSDDIVLTENGFTFSSVNPLRGLCLFLFISFLAATFIITTIMLKKRFENGLLGDEAYLNLSLPVTIGEHIAGRILSVAVCFIFYLLIANLCGFLLSAFSDGSYWSNLVSIPRNIDMSYIEHPKLFVFQFVMAITTFIFIASVALESFIYLIISIGHLVKKAKVIIKLAAIFTIMILTFRINGIILSGFNFDLRNVFEFMKWIWVNSAYYFVIILIYNLGSYFALKFKLNLE